MIKSSNYLRNPNSKEVIGMILNLESANNTLSRSGTTVNVKVQQGGPGEPYPELTLIDIYHQKEGKDYVIRYGPKKGKKFLLGRIPTLDTQFSIPRPVTKMRLNIHGLSAFNSIAFFGRRAEHFDESRFGREMITESSLIFPSQFESTT
jgi:hypothetical protein